MPLTRDFKETIKARADSDVAFRVALLTEAVELLLNGDVDTGKLVLRDYINATVGFEELAEEVGKPSKSLMRMFSMKPIRQRKACSLSLAIFRRPQAFT